MNIQKIVKAGFFAGMLLLILSVLGLYITIWLLPQIAEQYFDPAFATPSGRFMFYYIHPFVISLALSVCWDRFKGLFSGAFFARSLEFALMYTLVSTFPMLWLVYSALNVTIAIVATWFMLALIQGIIAGLVFEKVNP